MKDGVTPMIQSKKNSHGPEMLKKQDSSPLMTRMPIFDYDDAEQNKFKRQLYSMLILRPRYYRANKGSTAAMLVIPFIMIIVAFVLATVIASGIEFGNTDNIPPKQVTIPLYFPALLNNTKSTEIPFLFGGDAKLNQSNFKEFKRIINTLVPGDQLPLSLWKEYQDIAGLHKAFSDKEANRSSVFGLSTNAFNSETTNLTVFFDRKQTRMQWMSVMNLLANARQKQFVSPHSFIWTEMVAHSLEKGDVQRLNFQSLMQAIIMPPFISFGIVLLLPFFSEFIVKLSENGMRELFSLVGM
eukprot:TRINITY_DN8070_c0_g1_i2.p1 TRINITY_DN8070_c0_g1~~TRINITY_DN8070_c0_g1_i2.p1  ORF type:complete len:298 (-),score=85.45 TRINITY_DN8070_c0_g1_i2:19-912(-)